MFSRSDPAPRYFCTKHGDCPRPPRRLSDPLSIRDPQPLRPLNRSPARSEISLIRPNPAILRRRGLPILTSKDLQLPPSRRAVLVQAIFVTEMTRGTTFFGQNTLVCCHNSEHDPEAMCS